MPHYLVHLDLQIGEYEKRNKLLIKARNQRDAEIMAMVIECHGNARWWDDDKLCIDDMNGEMLYTANKAIEVNEEQVKTLLYCGFNVHKYDKSLIEEVVCIP